jgi:hypothetical protein
MLSLPAKRYRLLLLRGLEPGRVEKRDGSEVSGSHQGAHCLGVLKPVVLFSLIQLPKHSAG